MSEHLESSPTEPRTVSLDLQLDVRERLKQLSTWQADYEREESRLRQRAESLDPSKHVDELKLAQIASQMRRLRLQLVREPIEITAEVAKEAGYAPMRKQMANQFALLSQEERLLWLRNFFFVMTPDLRDLDSKVAQVRSYTALGQRRCFLLGAPSGMGKSTYLDWYASHYPPTVMGTYTHAPIVRVDAPVTNWTPKPLYERILLEFGMEYFKGCSEESLLRKIVGYFIKCRSELLALDEIEHIIRPELKRRILEISNVSTGVHIICASCNPIRWTEGDNEIKGRWNDFFELRQYTGRRLQGLLSFIDLILPFTKDSRLRAYEIKATSKSEEVIEGPARLIEQLTGGILRDIMILIGDASRRAILQNKPALTAPLLKETWQDIQTRRVTDFLAMLNSKDA